MDCFHVLALVSKAIYEWTKAHRPLLGTSFELSWVHSRRSLFGVWHTLLGANLASLSSLSNAGSVLFVCHRLDVVVGPRRLAGGWGGSAEVVQIKEVGPMQMTCIMGIPLWWMGSRCHSKWVRPCVTHWLVLMGVWQYEARLPHMLVFSHRVTDGIAGGRMEKLVRTLVPSWIFIYQHLGTRKPLLHVRLK